ncbi:MAG: hypothetical protein GY820_36415 [Gammaproteobacteria bacterium]|nr:hypothetical protein [Gammaproteobacteria bacterium]
MIRWAVLFALQWSNRADFDGLHAQFEPTPICAVTDQSGGNFTYADLLGKGTYGPNFKADDEFEEF